MKKVIYIIVAVLLINSNVMSQERNHRFGLGVGLSTSTNGFGANVVALWTDMFSFRLSYEGFDRSFPNAFAFEQGDFKFNVSPAFKTGGFSTIFDWYILKSMYLSGGLMFTNLNMSAKILSDKPLKIGDIEYTPNEMGEMVLAIQPQNRVAPYIGVGFGRNISRQKRLKLSFELGAYHTGSFVVDTSGTELFEPNGDAANKDFINNINETLKGIGWIGIYPIVKLGVSYRISKY